LSGYFYAGWLDLSTQVTATGTFQNTFQRYAVYGSYPVEKALFLGGYQYGKDNSFDRVLNRVGGDFNSSGVFAEGDYNVSEPLWLGVRYDWFDPATNVNDNRIQAITAIGNYSFDNGLQFIAEYQHKDSRKGAAGSQKDDAFQIRMIFIY
jgi:predicted porin